ncbi:hypothetical protein [Sulfurospirillum diekertiae]|uniref:Periplasmic protein n=1 Tax=Sulfurospirillum diekertiae TaxID=1854492 RepID=A0A1Y0HIS2_9BACT|nr:hypothetical protein [Sulfurospirillum diekertiae]ARU47496.1 hypothetical protein Sdiek1_0313 [Sulfurospirillum diekertiae]ASC92345.1 hypothetical protein Sdiek2_0307 [Sulfurospirillum diekertiae]
MKFKSIVLATVSFVLVSSSTLFSADFDWMASLNMRSHADPYGYQAGLASRFGMPESQLSLIIKSVGAPADAYMVLRLSELSGRSHEEVLRYYQANKHKGWGVMAKDLGIKPGSSEFKALKAGHDMRDFDDRHDDRDRGDQDHGNGNKEHGKKGH